MPFLTRLKSFPRSLIALLFIILSACGTAPSGPVPTDTPARAATVILTTAPKATTPAVTKVAARTSPTPTNTPSRSVGVNSTTAPKAVTTVGTKVAARTSPSPIPAPTVDCNKTLVGGRTPKLPTITLTILIACRPQVKDTIAWISTGKFKFQQDDQTFGNFEGYLPKADKGTYREYTVLTPGEGDRGARRLISSGATNRKSVVYAALYYTDDHYDSFWLVVNVK